MIHAFIRLTNSAVYFVEVQGRTVNKTLPRPLMAGFTAGGQRGAEVYVGSNEGLFYPTGC